ncbi:unnamed protein product [Adineta ricciae]|uniref:NAD(P)(+)--arginine ADP-ribosyltransferase n=1 Tax=Adineta ricciae TaxID=249248 RepID=A0A815XGJ2_ADIRI|nr:unnamed protein product [Adineta ricciae]CAF1557249.1 unnamed protein product [Adineta ricciae]
MMSSTLIDKKPVWLWQSNSNPWDTNEKEEWKRYSDFENEYIEEAFQAQANEVQLGDYIIDLKYNIQFKNGEICRQRIVKRELIDTHQNVRCERFSYPEKPVKSFGIDIKWDNSLIKHWKETHEDLITNYPAVVELTVQGILHEGKLLKKDIDAQRIANYLKTCEPNWDQLGRCAIRLYTASSFLCDSVNTALRNKDMTKVDTLGPFCYLLSERLFSGDYCPNQILYRGATLTNEMIEEYKQVVGTEITWLSFTSTTKDRCVAEMYTGNVLFIITLKYKIWSYEQDVSSISYYPDEAEVLLTAGYQFHVDKVEFDSINEKHIIYMTTLSGEKFLNPNMHTKVLPERSTNPDLNNCIYLFGTGMTIGTAAMCDGKLRVYHFPPLDME